MSNRERRFLIGGCIVIGALVLAFRVGPAWLAWRSLARQAAREMLTEAARQDAFIAGLRQSMDSLEVRMARLKTLAPALLTGATASEASASLAALVNELAREASVRLDAAEVRWDSSAAHALPRLSVQGRVTADVAGLASLVHAVESAPTLLAVRRLEVRSHDVWGPADGIEMLDVLFTIEAMALVSNRRFP